MLDVEGVHHRQWPEGYIYAQIVVDMQSHVPVVEMKLLMKASITNF